MTKTIDTSPTDIKTHLISILKYCRNYINNEIAYHESQENIYKQDVNRASNIIHSYADDIHDQIMHKFENNSNKEDI